MGMGRIPFRLLGSAALAFSLAGCVPTAPTGASAGARPQATAPALLLAAAPAPPAPALPGPSVEQQRVRLLIKQVEETYAHGETDYHKGRLPEAKQEFDRAVDLMLVSGIDIKNDAELLEVFDHIIDDVNALEMEAL